MTIYLPFLALFSIIICGLNTGWPNLYWVIFCSYTVIGIFKFFKSYNRELESQKKLSFTVPRAAFYALFWPMLILMIGW